MNFSREQISHLVESRGCFVREDCLLPAPKPPTHQVLVFGRWKILEPINSVIDTNPVTLTDMKMLVRVIVSQLLRLGRREISLLAFGYLEKLMGFFSSTVHAKTLH
jgi:hypothetical protein